MASKLASAGMGAATGAGVGSAFGPWGTAIGGLIGGLGGYFGGPKKDKFVSTLDPQQQQLLGSLLQQIQGMQGPGSPYSQSQDYLSSLLSGNQQAYEQFAAPYRTEFEQQTIPGIAERFAGLAGPFGNPGMSSGFGQALGGAATQYQSNLSNLFANIRQQAAQQAMSQYGNLLSGGLSQYQAYQPGSPGFGATALSGLAQGAGTGFGQAFGAKFGQQMAGGFNQQQPNQYNDLSGAYGSIY